MTVPAGGLPSAYERDGRVETRGGSAVGKPIHAGRVTEESLALPRCAALESPRGETEEVGRAAAHARQQSEGCTPAHVAAVPAARMQQTADAAFAGVFKAEEGTTHPRPQPGPQPIAEQRQPQEPGPEEIGSSPDPQLE